MIAASLYFISALICLVGMVGAYERRFPMLSAFLFSISFLLTRVGIRNLSFAGYTNGETEWLLDGMMATVNALLLLLTILAAGLEFLARSKAHSADRT